MMLLDERDDNESSNYELKSWITQASLGTLSNDGRVSRRSTLLITE